MSKLSRKPHSPVLLGADNAKNRTLRWPLYAGLAVIGLLVLAYIDAGEEPLRPIAQPVALGGGEA